MAFEAGEIPLKLREAYKTNRCALYVGAGASAGAGLPDWRTFLEKMTDKALGEHLISPTTAKHYRTLAKKPAKYLAVASGLKEDLGSHFEEFIEETFIGSKPRPTALHEAFVELTNLQFIVTTNYDVLIERAFQARTPDVPVCSFGDVGETQRRLAKREFFILKAHGDASKPGNGIVLTDTDYRNILYRQRAYQSLLASMFTMFTMVFIGASMVDPELLLLLNYIADAFPPTSGPSHYALLAKEDINPVEQKRWLKDYKVQVIPYSKANRHEALKEFVGHLSSIHVKAVP